MRAKVEDARKEVIRWLKKHWIQVRLVGGFDALDPWALKEISHGELRLQFYFLV